MSAGAGRLDEIRARLVAAFQPTTLEVIDESHKHQGHAGARDGRGHFRVTIVSPRFAGRTAIERHRMVFKVLEDLMKTDIHAMSIQASETTSRVRAE